MKMTGERKEKRILLTITAAVLALPVLLIVVYAVFQIVGAAVNHSAGSRQTGKLADYAAGQGFAVLGSDTFVGNSGNGNHVDMISSVFIAGVPAEQAESAFSGYDADGGSITVSEPEAAELDRAGIASPGSGIIKVRLFRPAPFADNIEGH